MWRHIPAIRKNLNSPTKTEMLPNRMLGILSGIIRSNSFCRMLVYVVSTSLNYGYISLRKLQAFVCIYN